MPYGTQTSKAVNCETNRGEDRLAGVSIRNCSACCGERVKGDEMGWASAYIARLQAGETVQFRPRGNSMKGKVESGQPCTVEPAEPTNLQVGDVVLCKVNGKQYLHLVKAIQGKRLSAAALM
jgi:hypothetical protein